MKSIFKEKTLDKLHVIECEILRILETDPEYVILRHGKNEEEKNWISYELSVDEDDVEHLNKIPKCERSLQLCVTFSNNRNEYSIDWIVDGDILRPCKLNLAIIVINIVKSNL